MEEVERLADNLIILERGRLKNISAPNEFSKRVSCWMMDFEDFPARKNEIRGLLSYKKIESKFQIYVIDQGETFEKYIESLGASSVDELPVSLSSAVWAYLSKNHA